MFARGRSKDRSSRKPTPPQASYMDSNQFANYLAELREKRVTRPGGAKSPGASSARTSLDPASAARTPAAASTTTLNTPPVPPFPRADSALSDRTTTTTHSLAPTRPSMSTSRSRRSMPPPASPQDEENFANMDPTIVQPSAIYIERGQRWMEREEAGSLRDALEDMDAAERAKAEAASLAAERLREMEMEEEERIQMAAQKEASELVFAHLHPEEVRRKQEEEEIRRQTGYRYHLRKGSYQHARAASVGREYKGDDAIIVDLNSRPGMPSRTFSDESTMRSVSRTSMRRESSDHSSRPTLENRPSTDEVRGRPPAKSNGKSYGTLSSTISGVASKSRSWSARRKSGGGKRNVSGEVNTVFHPDQIWEEPETSRESSKNRSKKDQDPAKLREDMYNGVVEPLSPLKRNPANRVQFAKDKEAETSQSTTPTLENTGLPVQKIDRFEIFRNPPSQSRNPLYTANNPPPPRTPSPDKNLPDLHMKDGKEIRNEELRKATTKSLKDRSEKLPTPTAVSDNRGRPIVSFDKTWMPVEEKKALEAREKEKALFDKNKADSCPPVSATGTKLSEPQQGGEGGNGGKAPALSAVEIAKRKIFGFKAGGEVGGPKVGERISRSCSPQRRSGEGQREAGREAGKGGEKRKEEEREGYFEAVGCPTDTKYELGKVGNAGTGKINGSDAEVKVAGKWIVETRKGVSTFKIEDEKTSKEEQKRKDGFPYRLGQSSGFASSSTRTSSDEPQVAKFAPRSPFARPSLGPTSLSTPPEMSLNKTSSVASRSPFGRPGGARSSMSNVSVPSRMSEIGPSPSVRRSPFDRPVTSHGMTHTRSSLGMESRKSIDHGDARPKSREGFSSSSAKAKLPWMRGNKTPTTFVDENSRPRSRTIESFKRDSPSERPVSREKELPWMRGNKTLTTSVHDNSRPRSRTIEGFKLESPSERPVSREKELSWMKSPQQAIPEPGKILVNEPVVESPPALEVTVNTADAPALYQDVLESPTKAVPEVVVKTADIAEQYDLVLSESKPLDEKANVPAPIAPLAIKAPEVVMEKKSSLSGARPLPMRPSGPRQSAPSVRRTPRHEEPVTAPPPLVKAQTVPEKVMPAPPIVVEPTKERPGHRKSTSISAPSTHAAVLAPPVETLSEVRPPAPEDAVIEQKPLPTIYGPPRTDTPPGFSPSLNISAPAIAIRAPSPAPPSDAPMIAVSAPAINVSGPSAPAVSVSAPPKPSNRPLPQPTRPLPSPSGSARPLPRPTSSSGRPLPAPSNARPMPHPSSRVAPPPNHARPSSDSTSHWSPAPAPVGSRATATCHACNLPIEGRVIALAGLKERWHPACMQCHVCSTALADFEISPEPSFARAARLARIEAREAGDYVAEGEATDGDRRLRFYCHLDWHEAFAPRCQHCKTPIIGEHITALGGKPYHYGHFFCCECGDPFNQGVPHVELDGYAWCTGCVEKRTLRRAPKCGLCKRNVVGEVVKALGKEFHAECFRCGDCGEGFVGGEIYLRDDVGVSCRECMGRWAKNHGRG